MANRVTANLGDESLPPRLEIGKLQQDFGRVQAGEVVDAAFSVRNRGGRRLILSETNGTCRCIKAGRPQVIVPPGATVTLPARLDTENLGGSLRLEIHYRTNDPTRPELTLVVLAAIERRGR
ncbi:MAG TPA: DUF1573 domain-containing protein [Pirellulales bacterium]|jgi:hypothetical protein|nr:DUF1573 domain-containing protein [Pirellulales bacterium]